MTEVYTDTGAPIDPARFLVKTEEIPDDLRRSSVCIEDRPRMTAQYGIQMPGTESSGGVAALMATYETQSPNLTNAMGQPLSVWAERVRKLLPTDEHFDCKGREALPTIVQTIVNRSDDVLASMKAALPNRRDEHNSWDEGVYSDVVGAYQRLIHYRLLDAIEIDPKALNPLQPNAFTNQPLKHQARYLMAIQGVDTFWNSAASWNADLPAYAANVGMYPKSADNFNRTIGKALDQFVDPAIFTTALLAYLGATQLNLPGQPEIVRV